MRQPVPLEVTQPHKVVRSVVGREREDRAFGEPAAKLPPIDTFAQKPGGYDPELAYLLAMISAWAYADERVLADKLRYYGVPGAHIRRIAVQNNALLVSTNAYLIQSSSGKVAVLAFRGTDPGNIVTVLTDTQLMQLPFFGTRVHAGFHTSVDVVWDDVHRALLAARSGQHIADTEQAVSLGHPLEALYITGHSLGGAMAVLAAARLCQADYKADFPRSVIKGVYTYGQPMVGDRNFATFCERTFGQRLFRHVYHNDVVPRLPPRSSLDYQHAGPELRTSSLDTPWLSTRKKSERVELTLAAVSVAVQALEARTAARDLLPGPSIDDHSPANYLEVSRYALNPKTAVIAEHAPMLVRAAEYLVDRFQGARAENNGQERNSA